MAGIKDVINTLDKAADGFDSIANAEQKKIYEEVITLSKDLETDIFGRVKQTITNLKRLNQIKAKLAALSKDKEWVAGIGKFVKYFDILQKQQNAYFAENFHKTLGESAKKRNEMMKQIAVNNTIEALMGDGLKANVTDKLNDILLRGVTSGAKWADLQQELRDHLMGKDGGQGAFARYATTYATTALSQYTGQNNQMMTKDLGLEWFMYTGSNIETTREFCEVLTQKKWIHKSEIPTILQGKITMQDGEVVEVEIYDKTGLPKGMIAGTTPENFQCNCGGWNCRHQLIPVADAVVPKSVRDRMALMQKLEEYHSIDGKLDIPTTKGKLFAATPGAGAVIATYENLVTAIKSLYEIGAEYHRRSTLRRIIDAPGYEEIQAIKKGGTIYGYKGHYETEKEVPNNLLIAERMALEGINVYLVPNIGNGKDKKGEPLPQKSADFITEKNGHVYYIEGKYTTGSNAIENGIRNATGQANRLVIVINNSSITKEEALEQVKNGFYGNKMLNELWIYRGNGKYIIKREDLKNNRFDENFKKQWGRK